jgi:hypothetical protein
VAVSTTADAAKTSVPIIRNFFKAMQPITWEQNQIVPLFSDSRSIARALTFLTILPVY